MIRRRVLAYTLSRLRSRQFAISPLAAGGYAGAEVCRSCHKPEFQEFRGKTAHATLPQQKDSVAGCEMCHGAGKAHADAEQAAHGDDAKTAAASKLIFSFSAPIRKQNSERCMHCHETSKQQSQFDHSTHAMRGVSCNDCHSPHLTEAAESPKSERIYRSAGEVFFGSFAAGREPLAHQQSFEKRASLELWVTIAMAMFGRNSPCLSIIASRKAL